MFKGSIPCPFHIEKLKNHKVLKPLLLNSINNSKKFKPLTEKVNTVIKCDYDWSKDKDREYIKILLPSLTKHLIKAFKDLGFSEFQVLNIWCQQYGFNDIHDWHVHSSCNFTCVYYLELPKNTPTTEYIDPMNLNEINEFNVTEGDVLIFPSFVLHRGKWNKSKNRKTIISFNCNVANLNNDYPENYLNNKNGH